MLFQEDVILSALISQFDERPQELLEAMTDGVLITDENGRCTYSNPALDQLVGAQACDPALTEDAPQWVSPQNQHDYRRMITRSLN